MNQTIDSSSNLPPQDVFLPSSPGAVTAWRPEYTTIRVEAASPPGTKRITVSKDGSLVFHAILNPAAAAALASSLAAP